MNLGADINTWPGSENLKVAGSVSAESLVLCEQASIFDPECPDGPTAIAYKLATEHPLTDPGAKVLSVLNGTDELLSILASGKIVIPQGKYISYGSGANSTLVSGAADGGISFYGPGTAQIVCAQGMLLPRLTKAQRNALVSPANGLVIYQTDNTPGLRVRENGVWVKCTTIADP